jgi:hypothetical protein
MGIMLMLSLPGAIPITIPTVLTSGQVPGVCLSDTVPIGDTHPTTTGMDMDMVIMILSTAHILTDGATITDLITAMGTTHTIITDITGLTTNKTRGKLKEV